MNDQSRESTILFELIGFISTSGDLLRAIEVFDVCYRCVESLVKMKTSPEAISGYCGALAALLGGVKHTPLGIPRANGKVCETTYFVALAF